MTPDKLMYVVDSIQWDASLCLFYSWMCSAQW